MLAGTERKIVVRRLEKPVQKGLDGDLVWFCKCMGFEGEDERVTKIFRRILEEKKKGHEVRSTAISRQLKLTRGGAVYHLNKMIQSGLIVRKGRTYELRGMSLNSTLDEIEEDFERMLKRMREMAKEIDEEVGLERRE